MEWTAELLEELRSALRPAQTEPEEEAGLRAVVIDPVLEQARHDPKLEVVHIPHVSEAGKPFVLTLAVTGGEIHAVDADHEPDLSSSLFDDYVDWRARAEVRSADIRDED